MRANDEAALIIKPQDARPSGGFELVEIVCVFAAQRITLLNVSGWAKVSRPFYDREDPFVVSWLIGCEILQKLQGLTGSALLIGADLEPRPLYYRSNRHEC